MARTFQDILFVYYYMTQTICLDQFKTLHNFTILYEIYTIF